MSVQRWKPAKATARYWSEGMRFDADGAFVTYTDHVAALAEAEQRVRSQELAEAKALLASRDEAWYAGVAAAREVVERERQAFGGTSARAFSNALAAIDGVEKP